ncbi:MAG: MFS transporter [Oscillospiraceae bacterium]|nr:MFS transporter [Oscillospiraceae bacterium]
MKEKQPGLNSFGKKGWWTIIFVGLLYVISSNTVDLVNVIPNLFGAVKGWDPNNLLIFNSVGGWVGVVITLAVGQWIAAKGVKLPTILMLLLCGLFFILVGVSNSIAMYGLFIVLLTAVGSVLNLVSTNTYMSNWFPRKKGIALGWATMGAPVSSAVAPALFMGAANGAAGENGVPNLFVPCLIFGIISFIIMALAFITKATPKEAGAYPDNDPAMANMNVEEGHSSWTVGKLLKCKQTWVVSLVFGLLFIALVSTMTYFIPRMVAAGFTQDEGTMWLTVASILGIIGSYLWGLIDQKLGTKKAVIIFAAYMAVMQFLLAAVMGVNQTITLILVILLGILIGGICNLLPSMVISIFGGQHFAAANSVVTPIVVALRTAAFIIMGIILGATNNNFGTLSIFLGIFAAVAFVLSFLLTGKQLPAPDEK